MALLQVVRKARRGPRHRRSSRFRRCLRSGGALRSRSRWNSREDMEQRREGSRCTHPGSWSLGRTSPLIPSSVRSMCHRPEEHRPNGRTRNLPDLNCTRSKCRCSQGPVGSPGSLSPCSGPFLGMAPGTSRSRCRHRAYWCPEGMLNSQRHHQARSRFLLVLPRRGSCRGRTGLRYCTWSRFHPFRHRSACSRSPSPGPFQRNQVVRPVWP